MKGKLFLNFVFFAAAIAAGAALGMKPWPVYKEQRQNADNYLRDAREAEKSRVDLERQRTKYETPLGREELARESGYLRDGESSVNIGE
jgi:hypothetical protein